MASEDEDPSGFAAFFALPTQSPLVVARALLPDPLDAHRLALTAARAKEKSHKCTGES